jgi:hypothetical protein
LQGVFSFVGASRFCPRLTAPRRPATRSCCCCCGEPSADNAPSADISRENMRLCVRCPRLGAPSRRAARPRGPGPRSCCCSSSCCSSCSCSSCCGGEPSADKVRSADISREKLRFCVCCPRLGAPRVAPLGCSALRGLGSAHRAAHREPERAPPPPRVKRSAALLNIATHHFRLTSRRRRVKDDPFQFA